MPCLHRKPEHSLFQNYSSSQNEALVHAKGQEVLS